MSVRMPMVYRTYECLSCRATNATHGQPVTRSTARYGIYHTCPECGRVVLTKVERRIVWGGRLQD